MFLGKISMMMLTYSFMKYMNEGLLFYKFLFFLFSLYHNGSFIYFN